MSADVTTEERNRAADGLSYEQRMALADQQLAEMEASIERGVKSIIGSLHPEDLPQFISQLPLIVPQIPTLRYPNLPDAGAMLDRLSRDLTALGQTQHADEEARIGDQLDHTLSQIATKLTTPPIKEAIRHALYPVLVQTDPNSVEAVILSVALMSLETMEPGDNPMLKQMVLQSLQEATQRAAQIQEMMANVPPAAEVKPSTRMIIRLGEGMARQLGRTQYLINFLNLPSLILSAKELEGDATAVFELSQQLQAEGREQLNDAEEQAQRTRMETTINLRYTQPRISRVISELQGLAAWAQQSDPQRFRDMVELANFAAGSFNLVPPGEHPILQALYAVGVNSLVNDMMVLQQGEQDAGELSELEPPQQAEEQLWTSSVMPSRC